MSKSAKALGIPEGVYKICPDRKHVIPRKSSVCSYCIEDEDRPQERDSYNPVDAVEKLEQFQQYQSDIDSEETAKIASTLILPKGESWKKSDPQITPLTTPPGLQSGTPTTSSTANIGPSPTANEDQFSTKPFPPFRGVQDPSDGEPSDVGKTQPLQAALGSPNTSILVGVGAAPSVVLGWLRGIGGEVDGRSWEIGHGRNILGSSSSCSVVIPFSGVSAKHASVIANETDCTITLLDDTGVLLVNGAPTQQRRGFRRRPAKRWARSPRRGTRTTTCR